MTNLELELELEAASTMRALVPPIKCQGIKSKLVEFISLAVSWTPEQRWIEPFMGSGVVAFSLAPKRALLADSNPHLIAFYSAIQQGEISPKVVRDFLESEGAKLLKSEGSYYYDVRDRFNAEHRPLDFLFLNRSCFNGMIRFNRKGVFNVPFNRKPERFARAYITKIVNQVDRVKKIIDSNDWEFRTADWRETLSEVSANDFVYADPPYISRSTDYFNAWGETETEELLTQLQATGAHFGLATWSHNRHRSNDFLDSLPPALVVKTVSHFYHLGALQENRNEIVEALVMNS